MPVLPAADLYHHDVVIPNQIAGTRAKSVSQLKEIFERHLTVFSLTVRLLAFCTTSLNVLHIIILKINIISILL
jgi:hypothetical protein